MTTHIKNFKLIKNNFLKKYRSRHINYINSLLSFIQHIVKPKKK